VPRVVSFIVLVSIILLIGALSFKVMAQFYVPLFLAAVLVVVFRPLHRWMLYQCAGRKRLAAGLTTISIVLIVLLPLTGLLVRAIAEGSAMVSDYKASLPAVVAMTPTVDPRDHEAADASQKLSNVKVTNAKNAVAEPGAKVVKKVATEDLQAIALHHFLDDMIETVDRLLMRLGLPTLPAEDVHTYIHEKLTQAAAPLAFGGVRILVGSLIGLAIMVLSLYYFFADGPAMIDTLMRLSPLDDGYEQELLDKFGDISRSVVLATLLSAVVQGLLASVGYYFVGIDRIFFLTALTMFLAMVPFIGAAAVWVPVCAWIYFYQDRTMPAALLALYCTVVVSMVDNVIKPMVLHGRSNLHPLLALLSVVGGAQALGPIGILVGPMLVALLQALLVMLNKELHILGTGNPLAATLAKAPVRTDSPELADTVVSPGYRRPVADSPRAGKEKADKGEGG
jgi:predicted PurR-regulated permease PerM